MALSRAEVRQMVWEEAKRQGVNPALAVKLAWQESRFNPDARSKAGAISVMQLMPGTAKDLGVNPDDVAENIRGGITYLKQQLTRFQGREDLALAAYNAGPGNVQKYGGVPPFKETQHYVQTILGGKGPPETLMASAKPSGRETAPAPSRETDAAPPTQAPMQVASAEPAPGPQAAPDWASVLFSDASGSGSTDWASRLFG